MNQSRKNATSLSFYQCNQLTVYRVDVASRISSYGRRFTNSDYLIALNRNSNNNRKLYTVLGGSAAYGVCSPDSLTSSQWLNLLQNSISGESAQVLNFSQPGSNISNHISIFVDEILQLKPDVHLSLSGYNEACASIFNYEQRNFTSSAISHDNSSYMRQKIFGSDAIDSTTLMENALKINCDKIVNQCALKYLALDNICKANSVRHVVALQPVSFYKKENMSEFEAASFAFYSQMPMDKILNERVLIFMAKLHKALLAYGIEAYNLSEYYPFNFCRKDMKAMDSIVHDGCHLYPFYEPVLGIVLNDLILNKTSSSSTVKAKINEMPICTPPLLR